MRIALGVEYDGSRYQGWQTQRNGPSVQAALEAAVARVADQPVRVHCAGRTDTGVHACAQVVHFDTTAAREEHGWVLGTNVHLPADVAVRWARPVPEDFHARFSAERRTYTYVIANRLARPAVLAGRAAWVHRPLDAARMARAARALIGRHDFSSFRAQGCQARSPVRTVHRLEVAREGELVLVTVEADGFLQRMVRNIAGVLIDIGSGRQPVDWAGEVLARHERARGGVTAAPDGLYLTAVRYPARFDLPAPGGLRLVAP